MEFGTVDGIVGCVRAGMGMTVLPRTVFKDTTDLVFYPLPAQVAHIDTKLITRKDVALSKAVSHLIVTAVRSIYVE
jgi:DNA-binding transcriptional LysR family regulator